jgi:hypothetical protein
VNKYHGGRGKVYSDRQIDEAVRELKEREREREKSKVSRVGQMEQCKKMTQLAD